MSIKLNLQDSTAYDGSQNRVYFLRKQYKDGCFLGFYSDSPWGRVHDMEKGWAVVCSKNKMKTQCEIKETYETKSIGVSMNPPRSFNRWKNEMKLLHGKYVNTLHDEQGELWKMKD
jgi:hypothetical protein